MSSSSDFDAQVQPCFLAFLLNLERLHRIAEVGAKSGQHGISDNLTLQLPLILPSNLQRLGIRRRIKGKKCEGGR
jgi:hypothetical protein